MATRSVDIGAAGNSVRANIRRVRRQRDWRLEDVATRLMAFGRPLSKSALSQIENGGRRVDVDDLVALALVLEVLPADLLYEGMLVPIATTESSRREMAAFDALPEAERLQVVIEANRIEELENRVARLERLARG